MKLSAKLRILGIAVGLFTVAGCGGGSGSGLLDYDLPGDISELDQSSIDLYSWKTFLALSAPAVGERIAETGDNVTQYEKWSSTEDLIRCNLDSAGCICPDGDCANSGARYYPPECQALAGFNAFRVIGNSDKADDSFLEAKNQGLSNQPVMDSQGNFVRYEILVSPANYEHVVANRYFSWPDLLNVTQNVFCSVAQSHTQAAIPPIHRVEHIRLNLPGWRVEFRELRITKRISSFTPLPIEAAKV